MSLFGRTAVYGNGARALARSLPLLLILAGAATGGATAQNAPDAHLSASERSVVGCYEITVGEGLPAAIRGRIPPVISLGTERRETGIWLRMAPALDVAGGALDGWWRLHPYGGLRAIWSDGISGLMILADHTHDGFAGTLRAMVDTAGADWSESPLQARRTGCSSMAAGLDSP